MLDEGQTFLAHDLARSALLSYPDSVRLRQSLALALLRAGALSDAKATLREMRSVQPEADGETLGLVGRVYKEQWKRSRATNDARRARDAYRRGFEATRSLWTGINAATLSWVADEQSVAVALAAQVLAIMEAETPPDDPGDRYWWLATRGEALLLVGRAEESVAAYQEAVAIAGRRHASLATSRAQLEMLTAHGFPIPRALFDALGPPSVVVLLSPNSRHGAPSSLDEATLAGRLAARLQATDARIGYSSAVSMDDILFLEAVQQRGAETHVLLPYPYEDLRREGGICSAPGWSVRFERVIAAADTVRYLTEESVPGDNAVFDYLNGMLFGYASLAAQSLRAVPTVLSPDGERLPDLLTPRPPIPSDIVAGPVSLPTLRRQIKTLLFADVVGYSKLEENRMPAFMFNFLQRVAGHLPQRPRYVNTWGDAIFAIMDGAIPLAEYALALRDVVCLTDWTEFGLPKEMSVRIGVHAGPVFEGTDPLTGLINYYGSHVNRAARLEGATLPGNVYASEQFAALLTAEQRAAWQTGSRGARPSTFACDYIGTLALPKDFGMQPTYHLRRTEKMAGATWTA